MPSAEYYREWRKAHPVYRARQNELRNKRRAEQGRGNRKTEYANRKSRAIPRLAPLFPDLKRGLTYSFWNEEMAMDLRQERELAILEGRDPDIAEKEYHAQETNWQSHISPLMDDSF